MQSPLSSTSSLGSALTANSNGGGSCGEGGGNKGGPSQAASSAEAAKDGGQEANKAHNELGNKALALVVQPSVDYGE